jgi:hypothetical protein
MDQCVFLGITSQTTEIFPVGPKSRHRTPFPGTTLQYFGWDNPRKLLRIPKCSLHEVDNHLWLGAIHVVAPERSVLTRVAPGSKIGGESRFARRLHDTDGKDE